MVTSHFIMRKVDHREGRQIPIIHSIELFVMLVDKKLQGNLIDV